MVITGISPVSCSPWFLCFDGTNQSRGQKFSFRVPFQFLPKEQMPSCTKCKTGKARGKVLIPKKSKLHFLYRIVCGNLMQTRNGRGAHPAWFKEVFLKFPFIERTQSSIEICTGCLLCHRIFPSVLHLCFSFSLHLSGV